MKIQLALALLLSIMVTTSAALAQEFDGQIGGVVVDTAGKPLADQKVELRSPRDQGRRVVRTTNANGEFIYTRLGPGRYEVELRAQDRVVATSGPIELSEGNRQVGGLILALPAPPPAPPPNRRRVSADRLLGKRPVLGSFDALEAILAPGVEVIVRDEAGDKTRGWVSSISNEQVVIFFEKRSFLGRKPAERIFRADSVARIDAPDSTWNGGLLGAVAGAGVATWMYSIRSEDCNVPFFCPGPGLAELAALTITGIGAVIDGRHVNAPVYQRPSRGSPITLTPMLWRNAMGVSAHLRF